MAPEFFTRIDIRHVNLHDRIFRWRLRHGSRTSNAHTPRINGQSVKCAVHRLVDVIDQNSLAIGLEVLEDDVGKFLLELVLDVPERRRAVQRRLPFPEQVEVWSIDDEDSHTCSVRLRLVESDSHVRHSRNKSDFTALGLHDLDDDDRHNRVLFRLSHELLHIGENAVHDLRCTP